MAALEATAEALQLPIVLEGYEPLPPAERRAKAAALAPTIRGLASFDSPMVGHFTDDPAAWTEIGRLGGNATSLDSAN